MRKISKIGEEKKNSRKTSVKGKQILVGGLVVLVAVAGYYRWTAENKPTNVAVESTEEETVPVMSTAESEKESYFTAARKDRDSSRSEAEDSGILQGVYRQRRAGFIAFITAYVLP